ncbi:MAG TPA: tetratricopeptide repeat protein [Mucilaginibacter sp.]|jgi:tetratricopeptide (TPR) repeat protein
MDLNRVFRSHYCGLFAGLFAAMTIAGACGAQQKTVDSLLSILGRQTKEDTVRLNLLNKLAFANREKSADPYADMAISLAKKLNQDHALAEAYFNKGKYYFNNAQFKKAVKIHLLALNTYAQLKDKAGTIQSYAAISVDYHAMGDNYINELEYALKAADLSKNIGDKKLLLLSDNALASSYMDLGSFPKALAYDLEGLKLAEELHDKLRTAFTLGNIGIIYQNLKRYPQALEYYNKCLTRLVELDSQGWIAAALNNIANTYLEEDDYLKAIAYSKKALVINTQIKNAKGTANDLMNLGAAYSKLNNYSVAFGYVDKALAMYDSLKTKNNIIQALSGLASMYCDAPAAVLVKRGIDPAKRYDTALKLQQKAVVLAYQTNSISIEADQQKALSQVYEKLGNYQQALKSYRIYTVLNDSTFSDKKRQEINRLAMQYDFDKKEALLKAENTRKQAKVEVELTRQKVIKNSSILLGAILLLSGGTSFAFYKRRKDAREKQSHAEFKTRVAETEMKVLRSQLNPHFIFNSLNSIGDYVARNDKETADTYLTRFAKLMRMILENSEHESISLADDLKVLELYIQLEALRLGHKLLYTIAVDVDIDTELTVVPPMLLQPFVENSIWHGISPKNGDGRITIRVKKNGDMIEYMVEDNGIGRKRSEELKKNKTALDRRSFGIKVIQSRIHILNEAKQTDAKVELTDMDEGTKVSIKLPYDLKF